eukprot:scaffold10719_cov101-Isochrysis_galbana.AAC.5
MHLALAGGVSDGGAGAVALGRIGWRAATAGAAAVALPIKHTRAETPVPGTPKPRARRVSCELVVSPVREQ